MNEPIESLYFDWLCAKVLDSRTLEYTQLMEVLFGTEFTWLVSADQHRYADALELRHDFLKLNSIKRNALAAHPVSIFEMMIAFANRAEFQTEILARDWFWTFLTNLNLEQFNRVTESNVSVIEDILHTFTWRIYEPNGFGGMFPIENTQNDQRKIEIWYQFCEYIQSRGLL